MHHPQNSLSHYPSPPQNGTLGVGAHGGPPGLGQGSPQAAPQAAHAPHWQTQLYKFELSRTFRSPHHRARANAMALRTVSKQAIPITNPNKPPPEPNGAPKEGASPQLTENGGTASPKPVEDHPSSTVGAGSAQQRQQTKTRNSTWTSLDMGGVQLKNLPPTSGLFSFTFLVNLYLNHNQLSVIPPEITRLKSLVVLDLSGNQLQHVPPELGMLTQLKELLLFDNHLTSLPPELGTLHQLQTLGIEGNPLDASLKAIIQKEGTPALISFLRDSCPMRPPPPPRQWTSLLTDAEHEAIKSDPNAEIFRVLSFNILCEKAATERLYGYTPSWALAWEYRRGVIMREIAKHDADFLCLQEVDNGQYEDFFSKNLGEVGYDSVYWPKSRYKIKNEVDRRTVDGCAIFFRKDKYQLIERHLVDFIAKAMASPDLKKTDDMFNRVLIKDNMAVIALFENRETGTRLIVANGHLTWDTKFSDVKLVQTALLLDEVEKVADNFARYPPRPPRSPVEGESTPRPPPTYSDGTKIPTIVAGDFNSMPGSGVYDYLSTGAIATDHPDFLSHKYGKTDGDWLRHRLGLKSAYFDVGEAPFTNFTSTYQGTLDYVWYSASTMSVNSVLDQIDPAYMEKAVGFPDPHHPSDHIPVGAEFRMKPQRDPQPPRPPPVFPS
ncbi:Endonuclease/exonuclease/phosphatase [Vararia minispora EC-137]|uniref:Endonuclease/exonuclease/phosphatase n=1 Tax=Vararia minispora EC-137 TaxID=1314806 RepID=A0ACB8QGR8_9AGAM|nr:Endonuclease/exonuclease/phosphatase [Vararia minispora EC-137]